MKKLLCLFLMSVLLLAGCTERINEPAVGDNGSVVPHENPDTPAVPQGTPPAISVTADGEVLVYSVAPNIWNGSIYDRTDLIRDVPFLRENSAVLEAGTLIRVEIIDYEHRPDHVKVMRCLFNADGNDIAGRNSEEVLIRQTREVGVYRFDFPFEPEKADEDIAFIGYRMFFYWDNEFGNEAEYAFLVCNYGF
jgi:hypothetical protein